MRKVIVSTVLVVAILAMFLVSGTPNDAQAKVVYAVYEDDGCASGLGIIAYTDTGGIPIIHDAWCFPMLLF